MIFQFFILKECSRWTLIGPGTLTREFSGSLITNLKSKIQNGGSSMVVKYRMFWWNEIAILNVEILTSDS